MSLGCIFDYTKIWFKKKNEIEKDLSTKTQELEHKKTLLQQEADQINSHYSLLYKKEKLEIAKKLIYHTMKSKPFIYMYDAIMNKTDASRFEIRIELIDFMAIIKAYLTSDPNASAIFSSDITYEAFRYELDVKNNEIILVGNIQEIE